MRSCLFLLGVRGKWVTPIKQDSGILLPKSTQSLGIPPFHPLFPPPPPKKKKRKKIPSYAIGADWFPCLGWKLGHWSLTFYKCLIKLSLKLTRPFILPPNCTKYQKHNLILKSQHMQNKLWVFCSSTLCTVSWVFFNSESILKVDPSLFYVKIFLWGSVHLV